MQRVRFPISKNLHKFKLVSSSRQTTASVSTASFANVCCDLMKIHLQNAGFVSLVCGTIRALQEQLMNAFNEIELWKGRESKFSTAKNLYDQLLQQLAGLLEKAEKDKETLENKLSISSEALESLSLKLDSAQQIIKQKDTMINNLEEMLTSSRLATQNLNSELGLQLRLKDKAIAECKEETRQRLMRVQEERAKLEYDHEARIKALRRELEDECRKLEEKFHLQKSKEDRQRDLLQLQTALLQLQWEVVSDKPKEDQEVNSKQESSYLEETEAPKPKEASSLFSE